MKTTEELIISAYMQAKIVRDTLEACPKTITAHTAIKLLTASRVQAAALQKIANRALGMEEPREGK